MDKEKEALGLEALKRLINIIKPEIVRLNEAIEKMDTNISGETLPNVTEDDNDKIIMVVDGKWTAVGLPKYDGTYEVTPMADNTITLNTAQTYMTSDVTVKKIPYFETTNDMGGNTVYIGEEV